MEGLYYLCDRITTFNDSENLHKIFITFKNNCTCSTMFCNTLFIRLWRAKGVYICNSLIKIWLDRNLHISDFSDFVDGLCFFFFESK